MIPLKIFAVSTFLLLVFRTLAVLNSKTSNYDPKSRSEAVLTFSICLTFYSAIFSFAATIWTLIP